MHEPVNAAEDVFQQALALHRLQMLDAARPLYERALELHPQHARALHQLGLLALKEKLPHRAVALLEAAIRTEPGNATYHNNLGTALARAGRSAEAIASHDRAIALDSAYVNAHYNRANLFHVSRQFAFALADYDTVLALHPGHVDAHINRALTLVELQRVDDALAACDRALELAPHCAAAHCNRGNVLERLERPLDALDCYDRALALDCTLAQAHANRGAVLTALERFEAALASCDRAVALDPAYAAAHFNRGVVLTELGRYAEALAAYERAVALDPNHADAHFNRSVVWLLTGDFDQGWPAHEWRRKTARGSAMDRGARMHRPCWLGEESLEGRTLLLVAEQGLGDTIQFCRYAPLAAERGARVVLEVPQPLTRLLSRLDGVAEIVVQGEAPPAFDYYCPLMSLPLAFKTTLTSIPTAIPYLAAEGDKVRFWRDQLGPRRRLRVGLVWAGGHRPRQSECGSVNQRRNIRLAQLAALALPDIEYVSLQKGEAARCELTELAAQGWDGPPIADFTPLLHDFSDTAALVENLDLVISVDTSTAHLAGALGKPVWILNRFDTCWRWLIDRADSPWYPTATLYRQQTRGDWDGVVARVARDLERLAGSERSP
jgi:tetratricopeptide (TPR) repeat protein